MRMTKAVLLFLFAFQGAFAQSPGNAELYWLYYEQGNALIAKKEYGEALNKYQDAISAQVNFPEAEVAIGDIYREEGETSLALKQYQKAYNLRNFFTIPDSKYVVLYKLARIYREQQMYKQMEDSLLAIVNDDKSFNEPATSHVKEQVEANYTGKGLDYILRLYRFQNFFAEDAHAQLGWFYYRTGRFTQSVIHLLYSLIDKVSEASQYMTEKDADFQFTDLNGFLDVSLEDVTVSRYLEESDIYKDLYYLAGSSFALGYPGHATLVWRLLSKLKISGSYGELSNRQMKSPWIEPYLK